MRDSNRRSRDHYSWSHRHVEWCRRSSSRFVPTSVLGPPVPCEDYPASGIDWPSTAATDFNMSDGVQFPNCASVLRSSRPCPSSNPARSFGSFPWTSAFPPDTARSLPA